MKLKFTIQNLSKVCFCLGKKLRNGNLESHPPLLSCAYHGRDMPIAIDFPLSSLKKMHSFESQGARYPSLPFLQINVAHHDLRIGIGSCGAPKSGFIDRTTGEPWIPDTARNHDLECPGQSREWSTLMLAVLPA